MFVAIVSSMVFVAMVSEGGKQPKIVKVFVVLPDLDAAELMSVDLTYK